ncbi:substrate-binding domain-containing protein [Actinokineospora soli]|uniref:Substrate-binding domain-containing protein n=1 Tax=Actinokineospora soli TaxID=1048753 RepID=A0ABW2TLG1_9PSEU
MPRRTGGSGPARHPGPDPRGRLPDRRRLPPHPSADAPPRPPTAIFAGNDGEALGVYQAAHSLGLRIPDDLSVVGFDDLPPAEIMIPALTTVRQPLGEMAAVAAELVVALSKGSPERARRVVLPTELVVRASTAARGAGSPLKAASPRSTMACSPVFAWSPPIKRWVLASW